MPRSQWLTTWAIALLAAFQALYWLISAALLYMLRGLFVGDSSPQAAAQTRNAILLLVWCLVSVAVLALYVIRRQRALVPTAVVQAGNFVYGMWLVIVTLSTSGLQNSSIGLVLQPAAAATTLVLLYVALQRGWIASARMSDRTSRPAQGSTQS